MSRSQHQARHDTEEDAFVRFAETILRRAKDWAKEQAPPTVYQRQFTFVGTSEWHEPVVAVPNYTYWLQNHSEEITVLPETQESIREL